MRRKIKKTAALLLTLCLLSGCGQERTVRISSGTDAASSSNEGAGGSSASGSTETNKLTSSEFEELKEELLSWTPEPRQTPVPHKASVAFKKPYADSGRVVTVLGLKEYKEPAGDFGTDKPGKGNCFLVLFLKIKNTGAQKIISIRTRPWQRQMGRSRKTPC